MAGIRNGRPEVAVGEPIILGDNGEYEIEQHPVSDKLEIRDTVNGKVAYVRKPDTGQIGGDGVLVKGLKESKPVADDGRVHDSIQEAERAASSWVFVPPGTFNESVTIDTEGLTLRGSGYNTLVSSDSEAAIDSTVSGVTTSNLSVESTNSAGIRSVDNCYSITVRNAGDDGIDDVKNAINCTVENASQRGIIGGNNATVLGCTVVDSGSASIGVFGENHIVANCVVQNSADRGIQLNLNAVNSIIIANRVINSSNDGIVISGAGAENNIIANNRVSDSTNEDIDDEGTNTVLDDNLTGASN